MTTPGGSGSTRQRSDAPVTEEPPLQPAGGLPPGDDPEAAPADPDTKGEASCDDIAVAGLSIAIGSPDFECDELRVIVTAADFEEVLACPESRGRCRCFGAHDRPGTYSVTVEAGDPPVEVEESREVEVEMDAENCHVQTETLTLAVRAPDEVDAGVADAGDEDVEPDPGGLDAGS